MSKDMELLNTIAESGQRVFRVADVKQLATTVSISPGYVTSALCHLRQKGWITHIRRGVYALAKGFLSSPLHEYEIAMALVDDAVISHWSAMHTHGLTDQIPRQVFVSSSSHKSETMQALGITYSLSQTTCPFGIAHQWLHQTKIRITDLERTLLDGLTRPKYCGGFDEVYHAFTVARDRIDLDRIIHYALQANPTTAKRLGWVLSQLEVSPKKLKPLRDLKIKGYRKLNAAGDNRGTCNSEWMIRENFYG